MSLLREIQHGATDNTVPLSDLLRKCMVLAKRLRHQPLAEWAEQELQGYADRESLPPYRRHKTEAKGTFVGPFDRRISNALIPSAAIEENHRDLLFTAYYTDGVANYEELLRSDSEEMAIQWPANLVLYYQTKLMKYFKLVEAWQPISRGAVREMLDQVRSRILAFALEIEEQNPDAGEAEVKGEPPVAPEKVNQIFNTYVTGGTNIVASGSQNVIRDFKQVAGDWGSLEAALKELGLGEDDISSLQTAIEQDGDVTPPGPAVKGWLGDVMARVAAGSIVLANNAAGSAIATLVLAHLGVI